jgi:hypothetical protein
MFMPRKGLHITQIIKMLLIVSTGTRKVVLRPRAMGPIHFSAWAMTFSKTRKKLPPQIFPISRSE